LQRNKQRI